MKMKYLFIGIVLFAMACQKDNEGPVDTRPAVPEQVNLVFPLENSECNTGRDVTPTESTIKFEWQGDENSDEYELNITNLLTSDENTFITTQDTLAVVLQRATPYSWYVVSKSSESDSTAQSEVWRFYNSGEGIQSYAPFPAEILYPKMSETVAASGGTITLDWEGSDIDEDIVGYDVHLGTNNEPDLLQQNLTDSQLTGVQVESGTVYYWSVTTKDAAGNTSTTQVFQFVVE